MTIPWIIEKDQALNSLHGITPWLGEFFSQNRLILENPLLRRPWLCYFMRPWAQTSVPAGQSASAELAFTHLIRTALLKKKALCMDIDLREILSIPKVQAISDAFYAATGLPTAIVTTTGDVLSGSGWQEACTRFHRNHPEARKICQQSDTRLRQGLLGGEKSVIYQCPHGLIDAAAPIVLEGRHVANYFTGQFLHRKPDPETLGFFEAQAERYGFEKKAYLKAIQKLPIIPEHRIQPVLDYLSRFAELIAETGYANLQNQRQARELAEARNRLEQLVAKRTKSLNQSNQALKAEIERRKQAETVLARERSRIYHLLNSLPAFVYLQRADYSIAFANQRFKSLFGTDLSAPCYQLIRDRDTPCDPCPALEVFKTQTPQQWEWTDGQGKTYQIYDYPFYDTNGELLVLEMGIDISERKQAEAELEQSRARYKKLVDGSPDILYWFSRDKGGFYISSKVSAVLGYTAEYLMENPFVWYDSIHPADKATVNQAIKGFWEGTDFKIEYRIQDAHGRWHWLYDRSIGRQIRDDDRVIEGLAMDITDLRKAQQRFETFFSMISDIFCIADIDGYFRLINPAAEKILGYSQKELLATPFMELVHPADQEKTQEVIAEQLKQGETVLNFQNRYLCKDGSVRWLEWTSHPVPDEGITFAVARDCTERLKTQTELERSNAELARFAHVASHDLQEPLRAIAGFLQLLQSRYSTRLDETGHHYIQRSVNAAKRLQQLIHDLLRLSTVHSQGAPFARTDMNTILQKTLEALESTLQEARARITVDPLPWAAVDGSQIQSLFQNLILNAVKYAGNAPPVIRIGGEEQAADYRFYVTDHGIGIDPRYHERIFEVFKRLHPQKRYPGTGVGLALCKKIVERHGGDIWVESQIGQGATFYFTLAKTEIS